MLVHFDNTGAVIITSENNTENVALKAWWKGVKTIGWIEFNGKKD